jgi:hypothetical protein
MSFIDSPLRVFASIVVDLVCSYREFVRLREGPVGLPVDASDPALICQNTRSVQFGEGKKKSFVFKKN